MPPGTLLPGRDARFASRDVIRRVSFCFFTSGRFFHRETARGPNGTHGLRRTRPSSGAGRAPQISGPVRRCTRVGHPSGSPELHGLDCGGTRRRSRAVGVLYYIIYIHTVCTPDVRIMQSGAHARDRIHTHTRAHAHRLLPDRSGQLSVFSLFFFFPFLPHR